MRSSKLRSEECLAAGRMATTAFDLSRISSTFAIRAAVIAVIVLRAVTYGVFTGANFFCH